MCIERATEQIGCWGQQRLGRDGAVAKHKQSKQSVFEFVTKAAGAPRYHFGMATNAWECPVAERMAGLSVLWWGNCSRGHPSGRQLGSL